jgi:hypothetical protein
MKKFIVNFIGTFVVVFFFGLLIFSLHKAYEERDNPNTTPERQKQIDDDITTAIILMG